MAQQLDPATREALIARVRFYRDLGLTEFYRRPVDESENVGCFRSRNFGSGFQRGIKTIAFSKAPREEPSHSTAQAVARSP